MVYSCFWDLNVAEDLWMANQDIFFKGSFFVRLEEVVFKEMIINLRILQRLKIIYFKF